MGLDKAFLTKGYQIMIDAVLLEQKVEDKNPNWVKCDPSRVHEMWNFGHHRFLELDTCFIWLLEAKRLKDKFCIEEYQNYALTKTVQNYASVQSMATFGMITIVSSVKLTCWNIVLMSHNVLPSSSSLTTINMCKYKF